MRSSSHQSGSWGSVCASAVRSLLPRRVPPGKLPALAVVLLAPVVFFTLLVANSLFAFPPPRSALETASQAVTTSYGIAAREKHSGQHAHRADHVHAPSAAEQALHSLPGQHRGAPHQGGGKGSKKVDPVAAFLAGGGRVRVVLPYPSMRYVHVIAPYLQRAARRADPVAEELGFEHGEEFDPTRIVSIVRIQIPRGTESSISDAGSVPPSVLMQHMLRSFRTAAQTGGSREGEQQQQQGAASDVNVEVSFGPAEGDSSCEAFAGLVGGDDFISVVLDPATVYLNEMAVYYLVRALLEDESVDVAAANVINGEGSGYLHDSLGAFDASSGFLQMRFEEQAELSRIAGVPELAAFREIPAPPFDFSAPVSATPPYAYLQHLYFLRHHQHATLARAYVHPDLNVTSSTGGDGSGSSNIPPMTFHRAFAVRGRHIEQRLFGDLDLCDKVVIPLEQQYFSAQQQSPEQLQEAGGGGGYHVDPVPALYRYISGQSKRIVRVGRALTVLFAQRTQLLPFDAKPWLSDERGTGSSGSGTGGASRVDSGSKQEVSGLGAPALYTPTAPSAIECEEEAGLLDMVALHPRRRSHRGDGVHSPVAALDATLLVVWRHPLRLPWRFSASSSFSGEGAELDATDAERHLSAYVQEGRASGICHCDAAARRVALPGAPAACLSGAGQHVEGAKGGVGAGLAPSSFGCPGWLEDRVLARFRNLAATAATLEQ